MQADQRLSQGLSRMGLEISSTTQARLLDYLRLMQKWNRAYNLTAIRDPREMVTQLLLDALVALPYVTRGPVLDVGSGAGLPGIPLAIARPDLQFTLLDSNGKKIRFIKQVVITLQLANVDVVQSRVENYQASAPFALIVSRAFSSLEQFIRLSRHLLAPSGEWLAWKGQLDDTELRAVTGTGMAVVHGAIPVHLPQHRAVRQLVRLGLTPH